MRLPPIRTQWYEPVQRRDSVHRRIHPDCESPVEDKVYIKIEDDSQHKTVHAPPLKIEGDNLQRGYDGSIR